MIYNLFFLRKGDFFLNKMGAVEDRKFGQMFTQPVKHVHEKLA